MPETITSGGSMLIRNESLLPGPVRLETMRVGQRVQQPLLTGNGMPVKLCKSEDLPDDWPPTMTSCILSVQISLDPEF